MRVSRAPRKFARKLPCDSVILIVHSLLSTTAASIHESMHLECLRPFLIFHTHEQAGQTLSILCTTSFAQLTIV